MGAGVGVAVVAGVGVGVTVGVGVGVGEGASAIVIAPFVAVTVRVFPNVSNRTCVAGFTVRAEVPCALPARKVIVPNATLVPEIPPRLLPFRRTVAGAMTSTLQTPLLDVHSVAVTSVESY